MSGRGPEPPASPQRASPVMPPAYSLTLHAPPADAANPLPGAPVSSFLPPSSVPPDAAFVADRSKCQSMKEQALKGSRRVRFMLQSMKAAGCPGTHHTTRTAQLLLLASPTPRWCPSPRPCSPRPLSVDAEAFVQCDVCEPLVSGAMYQKPDGDVGVTPQPHTPRTATLPPRPFPPLTPSSDSAPFPSVGADPAVSEPVAG